MDQIQQLFEDIDLYSVNEGVDGEIAIEGENSKHVLVICDTRLKPGEKNFLCSILASVKLDLASNVALLNSKDALTFHRLKKDINFNKLILLGTIPSEIGLNISYTNYTSIFFQNTEILVGESLADLEGNESSKKLLWQALKKMFAEHV